MGLTWNSVFNVGGQDNMLHNFSTELESINEEPNDNITNGNDDDHNHNDEEVFQAPAKTSASMLQFTRSIGALNAMSLGVQVLKAKVSIINILNSIRTANKFKALFMFQNAFLKALTVKHLTAEDYKCEGEVLWKNISDNFNVDKLIVADMDFTDMLIHSSEAINKEHTSVSSVPSVLHEPPPPPPLPGLSKYWILAIKNIGFNKNILDGSPTPPPPPPPLLNGQVTSNLSFNVNQHQIKMLL